MSVKKIGDNKYKVLWTTQKCEIETNAPLELLTELHRKTEWLNHTYPTVWSMACRLHKELEWYKDLHDDGENLWWKIVDPVVRFNNTCTYEG